MKISQKIVHMSHAYKQNYPFMIMKAFDLAENVT